MQSNEKILYAPVRVKFMGATYSLVRTANLDDIVITDGPSAEELVAALKTGNGAQFTVYGTDELILDITRLETENRQTWHIRGMLASGPSQITSVYLEGYYSTASRRGQFSEVD